LLVCEKPSGTVSALLRFLLYVADEETEEEVWYGLDALGVNKGTVGPELLQALTDRLPARRAVAACIVGRQGTGQQKNAISKMLQDQYPTVRLRAAQGLLAGGNKVAIPTLIDLLS
jgi:HEAT repeat protein